MAGFSDILNDATLSGTYSFQGGRGGSAAPSSAYGGSGMFDSSGWNVSFGNSKIASSRGLDLGTYTPYVAVVAAGIMLWKVLKKS